MIQGQLVHGPSKETRSPCSEWIPEFHLCAMIWVILDHWSCSGSSQRNAPLDTLNDLWAKLMTKMNRDWPKHLVLQFFCKRKKVKCVWVCVKRPVRVVCSPRFLHTQSVISLWSENENEVLQWRDYNNANKFRCFIGCENYRAFFLFLGSHF